MIAILLAIGGLVVVNLLPTKDQADVDLQKIQLTQIDAAMKRFKLDMQRWPTEDEGLPALTRKDVIQDEAEAAKWRGPYLEADVIKDKWNHELIFRNPSERGEGLYDIVSIGPDGEEGTDDDITNYDRSKGTDGELADEGGSLVPPPGSGNGGGNVGGGG